MTLKIALAKKEDIEMMIAASIAQPIDSMVNPSEVKPSMVSRSSPIWDESQATKRSSAPLITKEISPKVKMYSGKASIFTTGAMIACTRPKIAPISRNDPMVCQTPSPP